jgi:hypothetical protein
MAVDNTVDRCKADAGTREVRLQMKTLERCEQPFRMSHVESGPVIAHEVGGEAVSVGDAELDYSLGDARAEFPRISEQVLKDYLEKLTIALANYSVGDQGSYGSLRVCMLKFGGNDPGQL